MKNLLLLKRRLWAAACAAPVALIYQPASAAAPYGFAGSLDGSYADLSSGGSSTGLGMVNGSAAFALGSPDIGAEGDGGYQWTTMGGINSWNAGGSLFWAGFPGRAGVTVDYSAYNANPLNGHLTAYGAFGEYFFSDLLTAGLKGGGFNVDGSGSVLGSTIFGGLNGGYIGGDVTGYVTPDLALSGSVDYFALTGGNTTQYGVSGEYLLSGAFPLAVPVSVFGGYISEQFSNGGGNDHIFLIGLRIYTNGNGDTLRDIHRNGTLGWIGNAAPFPR